MHPMLCSEVSCERMGSVLGIQAMLALNVTFFTFFLRDICPLDGKATARSGFVVPLFQDDQMRKPSQTFYWNGKEK